MTVNHKKVFVGTCQDFSPKNLSGQVSGGFEKKQRVFVGMSGGVDSSVAALFLKNQDYNVVGVFMRCYNIDGCAERDAEDARRVAENLQIPFYVWDFEKEYKEKVMEYMIEGYKAGETPNPDVMCNREIKFGIFYKKAMEAGADFVATGHYVKKLEILNTKHEIRYGLQIAKDANKDQSYFLWTLSEEVIAHSLFPIGDYVKPEVRKMAREAGLPTAEKKDSQGICFLGAVTIEEFLKEFIPAREGAILDATGAKVGTHHGAQFYTIGQRHGLNHGTWNMKHGNLSGRDRGKFYVSGKNVEQNSVVVVEGEDNPALYKKDVFLQDVHFIDPAVGGQFQALSFKLQVFARVRYRQPVSSAMLDKKETGWQLEFDKPQKFVAPGQSAVFYSADGEMLGGGVISASN